MAVCCPRCSVEVTDTNIGGEPACGNCGHRFLAGPTPSPVSPSRSPMASLAGARDKLKNATRDLFRLSGGESIPVPPHQRPDVARIELVSFDEIEAPAPLADNEPPARQPEASIMFSLEELMKAGTAKPSVDDETASGDQQLWGMQASTPLFGTAHDQALLTTPMERPQSSSVHSMTVASRRPGARRPLGLLIGALSAGLVALAAGGWWLLSGDDTNQTAGMDTSGAVAAAVTQDLGRVEGAGDRVPTLVDPEPTSADIKPAAPPDAPAQADAPLPAEDPPEGPAQVASPSTAEPAAPPTPRSTKTKSKAKSKTKKPRRPAFNKGAAKSALISAAGSASGCRKPGQSGGKGKVQLTFATSGKVSSARILSGGMNGTATGNCALRYFRAARVPPFSGQPVTVAKSFKLR